MAKRRRTNRIKPLLDIKCEWDGSNEYPSNIRIAMQNGTFVDYLLDVKQPKPNVFNRSRNVVIGYQYRNEK